MVDNTEMIPVASSLLKSVAFDNDKEELHVQFHKGGSYIYRGVPRSVFDALLNDHSAGHFFLVNIKSKYKCVKEQSDDHNSQSR